MSAHISYLQYHDKRRLTMMKGGEFVGERKAFNKRHCGNAAEDGKRNNAPSPATAEPRQKAVECDERRWDTMIEYEME